MWRMRIFILLSVLLSLPVTLTSQPATNLLSKVTLAVGENLSEQTLAMFRQTINDDAPNAEVFYWVYLDKQHTIAPKMAYELATYYKNSYDYDKAHAFFKEWARFYPDNVNAILAIAEVELLGGKEREALTTYERVLELDPDNLDANIYIGNFYYLKGALEKQKAESDYKRIKSPTRMQYAHYKNELNRVLAEEYAKARSHFENVLTRFSSVGARKALEEIKQMEKAIAK